MNIDSKHVQINEAPLHLRICGSGDPILLLHAGIADSRMWRPQMTALCTQHRVIAPDLRGYGRSPIPNGPFSYQSDIGAILDYFQIEKTVIVGASFGSLLAVDYCLENSERVRGLVLISPFLSGFDSGEAIRSFNRQEDELLEAGDLEGATELNMRMWVDGPERGTEQVNQELRSQIGEMQREAFQVPIPTGAKLDDKDINSMHRLEEIRCPVLILVGEADQEAVVEHAHEIARRVSGARIEVVPDAGHMLNMEQAEQVNMLIEAFIQSV
jgi:3-oxoadipate enol-lactonase